MKQKSIPRNVSMYPPEWAIVEAVMKKNGIRKVSQALQYIVRSYNVQKMVASSELYEDVIQLVDAKD